jgi:hypothetical protein
MRELQSSYYRNVNVDPLWDWPVINFGPRSTFWETLGQWIDQDKILTEQKLVSKYAKYSPSDVHNTNTNTNTTTNNKNNNNKKENI